VTCFTFFTARCNLGGGVMQEHASFVHIWRATSIAGGSYELTMN
jgi:hypothetical protein